MLLLQPQSLVLNKALFFYLIIEETNHYNESYVEFLNYSFHHIEILDKVYCHRTF